MSQNNFQKVEMTQLDSIQKQNLAHLKPDPNRPELLTFHLANQSCAKNTPRFDSTKARPDLNNKVNISELNMH